MLSTYGIAIADVEFEYVLSVIDVPVDICVGEFAQQKVVSHRLR